MSSNPIAHPQVAPGKRHLTALTVGTAFAAIAIATTGFLASRGNDGSEVSTAVALPSAPEVQPASIPVASYVDPPYQLVLVSSADDLANARTLPGVELEGVITQFMVVNDEASQAALAEIEKFNGVQGMPAMSILDLR